MNRIQNMNLLWIFNLYYGFERYEYGSARTLNRNDNLERKLHTKIVWIHFLFICFCGALSIKRMLFESSFFTRHNSVCWFNIAVEYFSYFDFATLLLHFVLNKINSINNSLIRHIIILYHKHGSATFIIINNSNLQNISIKLIDVFEEHLIVKWL